MLGFRVRRTTGFRFELDYGAVGILLLKVWTVQAKLTVMAQELGHEICVFTNSAASITSSDIPSSSNEEPDEFYEFTPEDYYRTMSDKLGAIDFYCSVDKVQGVDGKDRAVITFDGKYLPYSEQKLLEGYIKEQGIYCHHCDCVVSPSMFEGHAGRASRRKPYNDIYTSNGVSFHELSISLSKGCVRNANENDDLCSICADAGDLLLCDLCPRAFHNGISCHGRFFWQTIIFRGNRDFPAA